MVCMQGRGALQIRQTTYLPYKRGAQSGAPTAVASTVWLPPFSANFSRARGEASLSFASFFLQYLTRGVHKTVAVISHHRWHRLATQEKCYRQKQVEQPYEYKRTDGLGEGGPHHMQWICRAQAPPRLLCWCEGCTRRFSARNGSVTRVV